jgi:magnesium chelatase subunit I
MEKEIPPLGNDEFVQEHTEVKSLRQLMEIATGANLQKETAPEDSTLADRLPFPFLALVGQSDLKLALLLSLVNPSIGGVLLVGPRGTGKTTAVRSLIDLLPVVERSACFYGCMPDDIETGGMDAVCPDCARKYAEGLPLTKKDKARLVELPLNSNIDDVVGSVDDRASISQTSRVKRGLLAQADQNILYIDEVNLLNREIIDSILDAAAQGSFTVRRGPVSATFRSRFTLIGSMNPEEGILRPQIMDRFGLRVLVRGLGQPAERLEVYRRVFSYQKNPHSIISRFQRDTALASREIQTARDMLPKVVISDDIAWEGIRLVKRLGIDSLRAEITLFEASRAYAAADGRMDVKKDDLLRVAPMALRLRKSDFISTYFEHQQIEEDLITRKIAPMKARKK